MSHDKAVQDGVRVTLPAGISWELLGTLLPDEIEKGEWTDSAFLRAL